MIMIREEISNYQINTDSDYIYVENLDFDYIPGFKTLKNLSFKIKKGDAVVILGENGSGKSTLFLCLLYLIPRFNGKIIIDGIEVTKKNAPNVRKKVGLLFQDSNDQLFLPSIMDEISFGPHNLGIRGKELDERINWTLRELNLQKFK